jgi:hypothetical protein
MVAIPEERVRVRDVLLARASDQLSDAVALACERLPLSEVAAFIQGDEHTVDDVIAGHRRDIGALLCERVPGAPGETLAAMLLKQEAGFLPCVFITRLGKGTTDVSIVALRMHNVH